LGGYNTPTKSKILVGDTWTPQASRVRTAVATTEGTSQSPAEGKRQMLQRGEPPQRTGSPPAALLATRCLLDAALASIY